MTCFVCQVARDSLRRILGGKEPEIAALHAGLECGVIGDKAPGMDMVSISFNFAAIRFSRKVLCRPDRCLHMNAEITHIRNRTRDCEVVTLESRGHNSLKRRCCANGIYCFAPYREHSQGKIGAFAEMPA